MNSWWLKLYTIPGIKKMALKFFIALTLVCLGHWLRLSTSLLYMLHLSFLYPLFTFGDLRSEGLAWNLEFHKMSVPLKELRKIFFLDIVIQCAAFIAFAFMSYLVLLFLFPIYKLGLGVLILLFGGTPSFLLLSLACFSAFFITSRVGEPRQFASVKKMSFKEQVKFSAYLLPGFIYVFVDFKGSSNFDINTVFCVALISLTVCVTRVVHFYYYKFHEKRSINNFKGQFVTIGSSVLACFAFCFMCGLLARFEINSPYFDNFAKNRTLFIFDDFSPTLEPELAQGLLNEKLANTETIFKNASPEVFQMPVTQLIPKPDLYAYSHYLKYGKPSQENLVYIMRELEKKPKAEDWKHSAQRYELVRSYLVKHMPNANALPKDLIKVEIERKTREVATEKADEQK